MATQCQYDLEAQLSCPFIIRSFKCIVLDMTSLLADFADYDDIPYFRHLSESHCLLVYFKYIFGLV